MNREKAIILACAIAFVVIIYKLFNFSEMLLMLRTIPIYNNAQFWHVGLGVDGPISDQMGSPQRWEIAINLKNDDTFENLIDYYEKKLTTTGWNITRKDGISFVLFEKQYKGESFEIAIFNNQTVNKKSSDLQFKYYSAAETNAQLLRNYK